MENIFTTLENSINAEPVRPVSEYIKDCEDRIRRYAELIIEDPIKYQRFADAIVEATLELGILRSK